jgi:phosphoenolpyruvate synthase/pyruvate phosphate dikinase
MNSHKLVFQFGYGVHGVSPLPHYFEEIYGHTEGISKIGPRGDKNYFWYSKNRDGVAYYEQREQIKSAQSTFDFLNVDKNKLEYFSGINRTIRNIQDWIKFIENTEIKSLSTKELFGLNRKSWSLDADIFSYYLISQPYRLQIFEDSLRWELKKRVASSRIDLYLSRLTVPEQMTQSLNEELDWLRLLGSARAVINERTKINIDKYPTLRTKILNHYDKYKVLTLGDGNWDLNPENELKRFISDFKTVSNIEIRIKEIESFSSRILSERKQLIKQLGLNDKSILATIDFLSKMSHVRYSMRVEGFIPLIYATVKIIDELAPRIGYVRELDFGFLTHKELERTEQAKKAIISTEEIKRRRGENDEYMLRINNGRIEYLYGSDAGKLFHKLVPKEDYESKEEIAGTSAFRGKVKATVTVYNWGDNMAETISSLKKHPILVAGQTRPAMMSIIRQAKGIITDEGGVTSHAAIVSRELGLPSIINTKLATKVFKTGDLVELDADNGIVRKII